MFSRRFVPPFLGTLLVVLAYASPVAAFSIGTHWDIVQDVLKNRLGWRNQKAIDVVIDSNIATDLIAADWGLSWFYPASSARMGTVQQMANQASFNTPGTTDGFHFDDLFTYDDIAQRWADLQTWKNTITDSLEAAGWGAAQREAYLVMLGMLLHAVQDFYCHSNYVYLLNSHTASKNFTASEFKTWDELHADPVGNAGAIGDMKKSNDFTSSKDTEGGLQTGSWDKGTFKCPGCGKVVKPWKHRHKDGKEGDVAEDLAKRASEQWVTKALAKLDTDCRNDLNSYVDVQDPTGGVLQIDQSAVNAMVATVYVAAGPSQHATTVNLVNSAGHGGGAFTIQGSAITDVQPEGYAIADLVLVAPQYVPNAILTSPDPFGTATNFKSTGELVGQRGGIGGGALPQSTFIDGRQGGVNCGAPPCWPGIRGDAGTAGVFDNVNTALGDSIVAELVSRLAPHGKGVNWRLGYRATTGNLDVGHLSYQPAFDVPRMIYRLYDPATGAWSPLDSTEVFANDVVVIGPDTMVVENGYRVDWPPPDKLPGATLPGNFTINGISLYAALAFLPRGTRMQYTFKTVEIDGTVSYGFNEGEFPLPVVNPNQVQDPTGDGTFLQFEVLPGIYPPGAAGSQLAGRRTTPLLVVDDAYRGWRFGYNPDFEAMQSLGVRADHFRLMDSGLHRGNGVGGHEIDPIPPAHPTNYFPNATEWALEDSLSAWYRLVIVDSGTKTEGVIEDSDSRSLAAWWRSPTPNNGGDRCLLVAGNNSAQRLLSGTGNQIDLAQNVLGAQVADSLWSGAASAPAPVIDDRFLGGGPGLGPPLVATYVVGKGYVMTTNEGLDGLSPVASPEVSASEFYPGGAPDRAGVIRASELDFPIDNDRAKAQALAYSLEYLRPTGASPSDPFYNTLGQTERARVAMKFLKSCRSARPAGGNVCWPCPTSPNYAGNWATSGAADQTALYGPLYPLQDNTTVVGVEPTALTPGDHELRAWPNPARGGVELEFTVPMAGSFTIEVFDVAGRRIWQGQTNGASSGPRRVQWSGRRSDGRALPRGVLLFRITFQDGSILTRRLVILS